MKGFKKFIEEDHGRDAKSLGGDGGHGNQYGRWGQEPVHMGVHRIEDPNVLQRLNAHIGLINTREYIDPRSALEHVQNALMRLGYHFDYNLDEMPNEQNVYALRRFGGRKGFLDMDAVVKEDDGIENTVGEPMVLRVEFVQDPDTSRYEVLAQIVPASLFDEEEVQPEVIRPNRASVPSTTGDSTGINMGESTFYMNEAAIDWVFGLKDIETARSFVSAIEDLTQKGVPLNIGPSKRGRAWVSVKFSSKGKLAQAQKIGKKWRATDAAFDDFDENFIDIGEAVSISMAHEKGKGTFEVTFDFRGGPTKQQAQKFALAAQKKLAGAKFSPNKKGTSETVVVTVKASSPREAQVKARKVLDENVAIEQIIEGRPHQKTKIGKRDKNGEFQVFVFSDKTKKFIPQGQPFVRRPLAVQFADKLAANENFIEQQITEAQKFIVSFPSKTNRNQALADVKKLASGLRTTASALFPGAGPANGVFFSVSDNGIQTRDLMKLIKKNKGTVSSSKVEAVFYEDLSRTFAFANADARDRIEKLLGLASREPVSTSDKGKGKFKFTVTAILKGPQISKIMKSVSQLKGVLGEEQVNESLSRTFAFANADARDRIEKLLNLASNEPVSTSNKGRGKFKFVVTAMLRGPQIDKIMKSVSQLKGKLAENTSADMANDAVRAAIQERAESLYERDPARVNQLKVARSTLKMNPVFQKVMGSPSKEAAIKILMDKGTPADKKLAKKAMNEASAFVEAGLKHARDAVKGGKQFVSVSGKMSGKKASQTIRGAAKFLMQHGTPADKKLAKKVLVTEIRRSGGQDVLTDPEGNIVYKIDVSLDRADRGSNRGVALANEVKKAGYKFGPGFDVNDFGQGDGGSILVNDAKNPTDARKKIKRLITKARIKAIISSLNIFKEMAEGVQIFPASPRFSGPLRPKPGKFGEAFDVEIGFDADDWKRLAPLVRKAAKKAKWKTFDIQSDKVIRVVLRDKDAKKAQKRVIDLVADVRKSIGVKEDCGLSHDDNAKELRRTKKDNKIASGFNEAAADLTVVAIKGNKVVGQLRFVGKKEVKDVIAFMKKEHPGAKVSVESKSGKIISVEAYTGSFKEQLSKRKKKAPASPSY